MRESVGERGVSVQKPKKLCLDPLADRRSLPRAAIVGRRGLICDGRFESEGITGRANHEGHRRPGRPTIVRAESGMAVASGPNGDGQVARDLPLLKSLKTATVAPRRWQSGARRIRPCWGRPIQWN